MTDPVTIAPRRMNFDDALAEVPRHFAGDGDVMTSHLWALLSAIFPEGEDEFVASVRHYRDQIDDPGLRRRVAGFIGQEAQHSRAHTALNDRLEQLGYPMERIIALNHRMNRISARFTSPEQELAFTVVFEHFTALLAEMVFRDPDLRASLGDSVVRDLLLWHAYEELEHKSVAFDVYRQVVGDEKTRITTMRLVRWSMPLWALALVYQAFRYDPAARGRGAFRRIGRWFRTYPLFSREMRDAIRDFERIDFHPDQRDTRELLATWRERLFGDTGLVTSHQVSAARSA